MVVKFVQYSKALLPTETTPSGRMTLVKFLLPENAHCPIDVISLGTTISVIEAGHSNKVNLSLLNNKLFFVQKFSFDSETTKEVKLVHE